MNSMQPSHLCLLCIVFFCLAVGAEDSSPATTLDEEKVRALAQMLGDDNLDTRKNAFKELLELGAPAWPCLKPFLESQDAELVSRLQRLALEYGLFLPIHQKQVDEFSTMLLDKNDVTRAAGLDGLLLLGPAGYSHLSKLLSGEGSKPVLRMELESTVVTVGEEIFIKYKVMNDGVAPFWHHYSGSRSISSSLDCQRVEPFGEKRFDDFGFGYMGGGGIRICCSGSSGYFNPIRYWKAILSGEDAGANSMSTTASETGVCELTVSIHLDSKEIQPRMPGTESPLSFKMNSALGEKQFSAKGKTRIYSLPDFSKQSDDAKLKLEMNAPRKVGIISEKFCMILSLRSILDSKPLRLEKNLARYAWYAWVDEKNMPVKWGSWLSVVEGDEAAALGVRTLDPGKETKWKLALPLPEKSGVYSLVTGYEGDTGMVIIIGEKNPDFDEEIENAAPDADFYRKGRVYARLTDIKVGTF